MIFVDCFSQKYIITYVLYLQIKLKISVSLVEVKYKYKCKGKSLFNLFVLCIQLETKVAHALIYSVT